jgi:hypothetical protein
LLEPKLPVTSASVVVKTDIRLSGSVCVIVAIAAITSPSSTSTRNVYATDGVNELIASLACTCLLVPS